MQTDIDATIAHSSPLKFSSNLEDYLSHGSAYLQWFDRFVSTVDLALFVEDAFGCTL